jgi:hypothetical protein
VRSKGNSGFIFVNNYERLQKLSAKGHVQLETCGVKLPKFTIPSGCMAVFPINVDGIRYATAQLVAKRDGKIYLMQIPGISTTICMQNGKVLRNVKARGEETPVYGNLYLLSREEAEHLFLQPESTVMVDLATIRKVKEAGPLRKITMGAQRVAEEPSDDDFEQAAVYRITLPELPANAKEPLMRFYYKGDCARLYANGKLVADHLQYGRPFLYGLWRLPEGTKELELRILPMQKDMPVYLPKEADKTLGEGVERIEAHYITD